MLERLLAQGRVEPIETQNLHRGDIFRTRDERGPGPWVIAKNEPRLVDDPEGGGKKVWHVGIGGWFNEEKV